MTKLKIKIEAYAGYGNANKIYCRGRILVNKMLNISNEDSFLKNAIYVYKNAESDEISYQKFNYCINHYEKNLHTNSEGFYLIEEKIPGFKPTKSIEKIDLAIATEDYEKNWEKEPIQTSGEIFYPNKNAAFAIVSDIDDTVLQTDVLSRFKWKIFYNTLFIKASKRLPIKNTSKWYQKLEGEKPSQNPFFYISHSPWNLYEYLNTFLKLNQFPRGPVLLRDFGLEAKDSLQDYANHKNDEVVKVLEMYPHLKLILIGDGGEKDAIIYLELKKKYPDRITAIFIHRLGSKKHQAKIEHIAKGHQDYFFFIKDADEGIEISKKIGLISA